MTADSLAQATELATAVALAKGWMLDARLVEQNVQISDLDLGDAGPCVSVDGPGVWFPPPADFASERIACNIESVFRPPRAGRVNAQATPPSPRGQWFPIEPVS